MVQMMTTVHGVGADTGGQGVGTADTSTSRKAQTILLVDGSRQLRARGTLRHVSIV